MRRQEKWMDEGEGGFTKKENRKKASYELVSEQVSKTWREISSDLLAKSFEAAGLILNPDGNEDDKMSSRFQAIVTDRMDEVSFSEEEDNESSNQDLDNEPNPDNDELDVESVTDCDPEDLVGYDSGDMMDLYN